MIKIIIFALLAFPALAIAKDVYVKPYIRTNGTLVNGHYRSSPNNTTLDNYSNYGSSNSYKVKSNNAVGPVGPTYHPSGIYSPTVYDADAYKIDDASDYDDGYSDYEDL